MFKADHAALAVQSLAVSRAFYAGVLGGRVVSRPSPRFLEVLLGDLRLHLIPADGAAGDALAPPAQRIDHLAISVTDARELEEVCARLNACPLVADFGPFAVQESPPLGESAGEHAEERPPTKTLYARDPDGLMLEIRCYA